MIVYMIVSKPPYEFPLQMFDSLKELGKFVGIEPRYISSIMCRARRQGAYCRYVRVDIGNMDDDCTYEGSKANGKTV